MKTFKTVAQLWEAKVQVPDQCGVCYILFSESMFKIGAKVVNAKLREAFNLAPVSTPNPKPKKAA